MFRFAASIRCLTAANLGWLLAAPAIGQGLAAGAQAAIEVELSGRFAPAVVTTVARIGEPSRVELGPGQSFRELVAARCGGVAPAYVEAFLRENPELSAADLDALAVGTYVFPACARAPELAARVLADGERIETIYRDRGILIDSSAVDGAQAARPATQSFACLERPLDANSGGPPVRTCSATEFAATENALQFAIGNPKLDTRRIVGGETAVMVPEEAVRSVIPLRPGVTRQAAQAQVQAALTAAGGSAAGEVGNASVATLVADTQMPEGSCTGGGADWPFSVAGLRDALRDNEPLHPQKHRIREPRVLVLDTGFDERLRGRGIPDANLGHMMAYGLTSGSTVHSGVNLATYESDATPPSGLPNRLHGSEVGALVLGGAHLEADRAALGLPTVQVSFASIATQSSQGPFLSPPAINRAIKYARDNAIPIINGSVFASVNRAEFDNALNRYGEGVVLITAAGNSGDSFDSENLTWPGGLGGDPQNAPGGVVVTVGSHDSSGAISYFSRRGDHYVDLLAPGCSVPTFSYREDGSAAAAVELVSRSGTSYAAPLVSLVASLLYREGLNPSDIKARLIMSVDVDGALDTLVYSRGRLNVRKALGVWQEMVHYSVPPAPGGTSEERWVVGDLQSPNQRIRICNSYIAQSRLMKLSIAGNSEDDSAPRQAYAWERRSEPDAPPHTMRRRAGCALNDAEGDAASVGGDPIVIRDRGTGQNVTIEVASVIDFIARSMR